MRKKYLLTSAAVVLALSLAGCSNEEDKSDDKKEDTKNTVEETTQSDDSDEETSSNDPDKTEDGILKKFLKNFHPTYEVNKSDGSSYYFMNENVTFDSTIDTLKNVNKYIVPVLDENFEEETDTEFSTWTEFKDKYMENSSEYIDITFGDGSETIDVDILEASNLDDYHDIVGTHRQAVSYEELRLQECFQITESISGADDISGYFNIDMDKESGISEQILDLKEAWGEPSLVATTNTYASIYWCFENTSISFLLYDINGDLYLSDIIFYWCDFETAFQYAQKIFSYEKFVDAPEIKEEEETTSNESEETEPETTHYEPNLPEQVLLTYEGQSVPIIGKRSNEILGSLGLVEDVDYNSREYSGGAMYTNFYYTPSQFHSLALDEKLYDDILKIWSVKMDFIVGINVPDISILGVKPGDTPDDFSKIFGTCENRSESQTMGDSSTYYYYNVTIEGINMNVTICTDKENSLREERVNYIRIDEIKYN